MNKNICFLNSNDSTGLLGFGGNQLLRLQEHNTMDNIQTFIDENSNRYIFLCLSYDLKNEIEQLSSSNFDSLGFPNAVLWVPKCVVKINDDVLEIVQGLDNEDNLSEAKRILASLVQPKQNENKNKVIFGAGIDKEEYINSVKKLKNHIQRGDIYEVNFCKEYTSNNVDLETVKNTYFNINNITKAPFSSYFKFDEYEVFCGSPERFMKRQGQKLLTQPIKGTSKRGFNGTEDTLLKTRLERDPKERSENIMIVDLMRNDLSKIAQKGSVKVEELCKIYSFKTVHQMISTVSCMLKPELKFLDILNATFPMGSMTGAPKIRAMQLIEEHESFKRGLYSGSIGYIDPSGDFDLNVIIRTIIYNQNLKTLSCAVGSAITISSEPEKEYEECGIKIQKLLDGIAGQN